MAKLDARRVAAFLKDPGPVRAVLLHGEDAGLIRERADGLQQAVLGGDDPFRYADLPRDAASKPGALAAEMSALALTGGRRLVRVRDATDTLATGVKDALSTPGDTLLVLEAGELPARAKLRSLLEPHPQAAVIACYRERGADLANTIATLLREQGVQADPSALEWLAGRLGEDRMLLRREIEKLALYAGEGGHLGEDDVLACVGDGSTLDLDEALIAATAGEIAVADRALDVALSEGAHPVMVVRAALRHVQRLHLASLAMAEGAPAGAALDGLRPPVFFRHKPGFERALRCWSPSSLAAAGDALLEAEKRTKSSSAARPVPDQAIARAAILTLARQAFAARRRG
ncbi:DNA polymerase III, delta subunit [Acetobacteraceae bacterium AT-5844]|nr:DNA polymerase III, delta subunit [Acetobacteraceae bacterium AT-5844]